jgi:hypothetical protein
VAIEAMAAVKYPYTKDGDELVESEVVDSFAGFGIRSSICVGRTKFVALKLLLIG